MTSGLYQVFVQRQTYIIKKIIFFRGKTYIGEGEGKQIIRLEDGDRM